MPNIFQLFNFTFKIQVENLEQDSREKDLEINRMKELVKQAQNVQADLMADLKEKVEIKKLSSEPNPYGDPKTFLIHFRFSDYIGF